MTIEEFYNKVRWFDWNYLHGDYSRELDGRVQWKTISDQLKLHPEWKGLIDSMWRYHCGELDAPPNIDDYRG